MAPAPQPALGEEPAREYVESIPQRAPDMERVVEHPSIAALSADDKGLVESIQLPPGLVQIETDPEKVREAASRVEPEPPPRPPRVRPPLAAISDEPLVQIETRK